MKFFKTSFRKGPKGFDTINMICTIYKFIYPMFNPIVLFITHINEAIVPSPIIGMNDTIRVYFASNNALKCLCGTIRNDFCVHFSTSLENSENRSLSTSATTPFSFYPSGSEVRFIDFNNSGKRRGFITKINNSFSY
jgi:hypothetical protein